VRLIKSSDPDILLYKQGGGIAVLFGLPFFLMGLFMLSAPLGIFLPTGGDLLVVYVAAPLGGVFAALGGWFMVGRVITRIDRRQRRITVEYKALVTWRRRIEMLGPRARVVVNREIRRSKNSTRTVYPVRLRNGRKEATIAIGEFSRYQEARQRAERLGAFLNVAVEDSAEGKIVIREAGTLDESLRERAERCKEKVRVPDPPTDMRPRIEEDSGSLSITFPRAGVSAGAVLHLMMLLIFTGAALLMAGEFLTDSAMSPRAELGVLGLVGIAFVGIPVASAMKRIIPEIGKRCRVLVDHRGIYLEEISVSGKKITEIPADQLEELKIVAPDVIAKHAPDRKKGGSRSAENCGRPASEQKAARALRLLARLKAPSYIVGRSDYGEIAFGHGLSHEELAYVYAVVKKRLIEGA